jgi:hypothetical protein
MRRRGLRQMWTRWRELEIEESGDEGGDEMDWDRDWTMEMLVKFAWITGRFLFDFYCSYNSGTSKKGSTRLFSEDRGSFSHTNYSPNRISSDIEVD